MDVLIYIFLTLVTIFITLASINIIKSSHSVVLVLPIFVIYYWSLYGAWSWIPFKESGMIHYYEEDLFKVPIDEFYMISILYYSVFLVTYTLLALHGSRYKIPGNNRLEMYLAYLNKLRNNNRYYLIIILCLLFFLYFARQDITTAMISGKTAYEVGRNNSSAENLYTVFQFSGDLFMILSVPLLLVIHKKDLKIFILILLMATFFLVNLFLGNRNVFVVGLSAYILLYSEVYGLKKLLSFKNVIIGCGVLLCIESIYFLRALEIDAIMEGKTNFDLSDLFIGLTGSSEKYAAHLSMYGVLAKDVSITYGSSILRLLDSFIPSMFGLERSMDIYHYYISQTVAHPSSLEVGVTIHHATAWYLNFGFAGIIIGALLWSWIQNYLYKRREKFTFLYMAIIFSSLSVQMIRGGGLEVYKGTIVMDILIPLIIIKLSFIKFVWGDKR